MAVLTQAHEPPAVLGVLLDHLEPQQLGIKGFGAFDIRDPQEYMTDAVQVNHDILLSCTAPSCPSGRGDPTTTLHRESRPLGSPPVANNLPSILDDLKVSLGWRTAQAIDRHDILRAGGEADDAIHLRTQHQVIARFANRGLERYTTVGLD